MRIDRFISFNSAAVAFMRLFWEPIKEPSLVSISQRRRHDCCFVNLWTQYQSSMVLQNLVPGTLTSFFFTNDPPKKSCLYMKIYVIFSLSYFLQSAFIILCSNAHLFWQWYIISNCLLIRNYETILHNLLVFWG